MKKKLKLAPKLKSLLKEARAAIVVQRFNEGARRWLKRIAGFAGLQLLIAAAYSIYIKTAMPFAAWVGTLFLGAVGSIILALFVGIIPIYKNWEYSWRIMRSFHVIFAVFLLGVFIAMFFAVENFGFGLWMPAE